MHNSRITKIEKSLLPELRNPFHKKKVAVYARVSTTNKEQQNSIKNQKEYYEKIIDRHVDWDLEGIYEDNGITGTACRNRDGFNALMKDCEAGKIDIVITKSVSRFARNTVDSLNAIRKLKSLWIGIYFEKEDIWTLDGKGEFLIALMSGFAQEESKSISENTAWAIRKNFADGKYAVPYSMFLGYDRGIAGGLVVNKEQAKVIRLIYKMYIQGLSSLAIADVLTQMEIPTPGKKEKWQQSTVMSILTNEKYKGDALLQKRFTADFLTKKKQLNRGELPKYYVTGGHEAIISPVVFDYVQILLKERMTQKDRYCGINVYTNKVYCGLCGTPYGGQYWHSTSYNDYVWVCRNRNRKMHCRNVYIYDVQLRDMFVKIQASLVKDRRKIISTCNKLLVKLGLSEKVGNLGNEYKEFRYDDIADFSIILKSAVTFPDRRVKFTFIDGTQKWYVLDNFTPRKNSNINQSIDI